LAVATAALAGIGRAFLATINPAQISAQALEQTHKTLAKKSEEILGFNFVNLAIQLVIFYAIAFGFAKFMEAVIFFRGGFSIVAGLFGIKIPAKELFPQSLLDLFNGGISGFKYWDVIKIISVGIIVAEFMLYLSIKEESGKRLSPIAVSIFLALAIAFGIVTFPELISRLRSTMSGKEQLV